MFPEAIRRWLAADKDRANMYLTSNGQMMNELNPTGQCDVSSASMCPHLPALSTLPFLQFQKIQTQNSP